MRADAVGLAAYLHFADMLFLCIASFVSDDNADIFVLLNKVFCYSLLFPFD